MHRAVVAGYVILAVGVCIGLYFATAASTDAKKAATIAANERAARSVELNRYLAKQCERDEDKDAVFVGILNDSLERARTAHIDPALRAAYIRKTSDDIARIRAVDRRCVADIPPPLPSHRSGG